jgi:glutamate 5-kinase
LSPGVVTVDGNFDVGDIVDVVDGTGVVVARGTASMAASELREVMGKRSADVPDGVSTMLIHRDEMVVFNSLA